MGDHYRTADQLARETGESFTLTINRDDPVSLLVGRNITYELIFNPDPALFEGPTPIAISPAALESLNRPNAEDA